MAASGSSAISQNHQRLLRDLVVGSGQIGVFVEYTPLPEARFPTQLEQSYAALKWVGAHAEEFGADGSRIAVAGNSVGGNMTCRARADGQGPQRPQDQLPGAADSGDRRQRRHAVLPRVRDRPLPDARLHEVRLGPVRSGREDPRQSLCVAAARQPSELNGFPPALVITAENDPLRDEGEAYARKLKEAGVRRCDPLQWHDLRLRGAERAAPWPSTEAAIDQINAGLRQHLELATH